jgi:adenylate cyclase
VGHVAFFLNGYFEVIGSAVTRAGGITNQFTGGGVMALFGVGTGPEAGCRQALVGGGEIARSVAELSRDLAEELGEPLRIGIGIHAGPAVVGRMGYAEAVYLTAVGDTVHVASRLEGLTKEYDCQLVISEEVARRAGADVAGLPAHELNLRGRVERLGSGLSI